jgi:hypothetical protein
MWRSELSSFSSRLDEITKVPVRNRRYARSGCRSIAQEWCSRHVEQQDSVAHLRYRDLIYAAAGEVELALRSSHHVADHAAARRDRGRSKARTVSSGQSQQFSFPSGTPATAPSAHAAEPGGTSGIIIDNAADQGGGTEFTTDIYFLGAQSGGIGQVCTKYSGGTNSGNCAVSPTQKGLQ